MSLLRRFSVWVVLILLLRLPTWVPAATEGCTVKELYPTLSSGALASAELVSLPAGLILRSGEVKITQKDLDAEIRKSRKEIWPQLKRNLFFVLESVFTRALITWEAGSWAKTTPGAPKDGDSLIRAYFASLSKHLTVTDEEIKSFYEQNKDVIGEASLDQLKSQLKDYLLQQKKAETIQSRIDSLSDRYKVDLDERWVAKQHSAAMDNPVDKARKSGMPSLVDFYGEGCRPCQMMNPVLESVGKEYKGKLNLVLVNVTQEQVLAARYGVGAIPVQVFFDKDGREVFRHVGFFSKDQITVKLTEMGVK